MSEASDPNAANLLLYQTEDGSFRLDVPTDGETVWLTQQQMANLFGKARSTITGHIQNIFEEAELDSDVVCREFRLTTSHGAIEGKIVNIAQNITETNQGLMYYEVWVETTTETFSKSDVIPNIMPGMVAQVDILGKKTRIIDYILTPLKHTASIALTEQ